MTKMIGEDCGSIKPKRDSWKPVLFLLVYGVIWFILGVLYGWLIWGGA